MPGARIFRRLTRPAAGARLPLWRSLLVLIVVGFGGLALLLRPGEGGDPALPPAFALEPDLYLEDAAIAQYRNDGSLHYRLAARHITHFEQPRSPDGPTALLVEPRLVFYGPEGPPWRLRATEGEMRPAAVDGEEQVDLRGDVQLTQARGDGQAQVRTEALTVYPARQQARSDESVLLLAALGRASAAGLEADLGRGRMTLRSSPSQRVSLVLQPPPANSPDASAAASD